MLNTVDKIYDIADRFAQFKEPISEPQVAKTLWQLLVISSLNLLSLLILL